MTLLSRAYVNIPLKLSVSPTISEIFSVKECRDFESGSRSRSRSLNLKMTPHDKSYTIFYWSAIVSIALCCIIIELFDVE